MTPDSRKTGGEIPPSVCECFINIQTERKEDLDMFTLSNEQKISNVREQISEREAKIRRIQDEIKHLKIKEQKLLNNKHLNPEPVGSTQTFSSSSERMNLFNQN